MTPVKAWIAAGDYAVGLLFAFGNVAIAPVSMGGLAIGLLSFGGCCGRIAFAGRVQFGGLVIWRIGVRLAGVWRLCHCVECGEWRHGHRA